MAVARGQPSLAPPGAAATMAAAQLERQRGPRLVAAHVTNVAGAADGGSGICSGPDEAASSGLLFPGTASHPSIRWSVKEQV
mmetsp:Transcript_57644/g.166937  ORF Transcript_57644/g.166937 Transcript_57644/m.166937 type:complete len:82 (-) Transcript_57644:70-315(-)